MKRGAWRDSNNLATAGGDRCVIAEGATLRKHMAPGEIVDGVPAAYVARVAGYGPPPDLV